MTSQSHGTIKGEKAQLPCRSSSTGKRLERERRGPSQERGEAQLCTHPMAASREREKRW